MRERVDEKFFLLDAPPDDFFEGVVELICRGLSVPIAIISFFDGDRQFFMASRGLPEPLASQREGPRNASICRHVAEMNRPLNVEDALVHPLVQRSPAVTEGGVGAYLGYPLHDSTGTPVGSICAVDAEWRRWQEQEQSQLQGLARIVDAHIRALTPSGPS